MLTIRRATQKDKDALKSICLAIAGAQGHFDHDFERILALAGIVVAEVSRSVAGFGGIDLHAREQIKWLYLRAEHQKRGFGSQILNCLEDLGWSAGLDALRVHAAPAAENFYRRHGYKSVAAAEHAHHDHEGVELMKKSLARRVSEALREEVSIVAYDPNWPEMFAAEAEFLQTALPSSILKRIEHFGSTAVPGLSGKPVIDILVEVTTFEETKQRIVPLLQLHDYEYFWRTDVETPYPWFIKRDARGVRTHHLHMITAASNWWDRLYFRDYLRLFQQVARDYENLKSSLAKQYPNDRKAYSDGKNPFIVDMTARARQFFANPQLFDPFGHLS